jgi:DNA-binding response OmpR family regulator
LGLVARRNSCFNIRAMKRVLYIGSDQPSITSIANLVTGAGYELTVTESGEGGCEVAKNSRFDAVMVDDAIAGSMSGARVCLELRRHFISLGIIFLYTFERTDQALEAFSMGADDCICKMPSDAEFRARLAALIRRSSPHVENKVFYDSIEIEPLERTVTVQGSRVELTPIQYQMLVYFLRNVGRPISPSEFKRSIFRSEQAIDSSKLRVHIYKLRRRLGSVGRLIESVRGKGYGIGLGLSRIYSSIN